MSFDHARPMRDFTCAYASPDEASLPQGGELSGKFFIYVGCLDSNNPLREIIEDLPKAKARPPAICRKDAVITSLSTKIPAPENL